MYVHNSASVRVKGGESERFRVDGRVRQGFIMSSWLFNVYMDGVMKKEDGDGKKRSDMPGGWERVEIALASCM